jgi:hypothetical protein
MTEWLYATTVQTIQKQGKRSRTETHLYDSRYNLIVYIA